MCSKIIERKVLYKYRSWFLQEFAPNEPIHNSGKKLNIRLDRA